MAPPKMFPTILVATICAAGACMDAKDPVRFGGRRTNLYEYAGSDPVNWLDHDGHELIAAGFGAITGAISGALGAAAIGGSATDAAAGILSASILGVTHIDPHVGPIVAESTVLAVGALLGVVGCLRMMRWGAWACGVTAMAGTLTIFRDASQVSAYYVGNVVGLIGASVIASFYYRLLI